MKKVRDVLLVKGSDVYSISPDATVYDAIRLMSEKRVGALMVMEGDRLVGVVSETDYARKIVLKGRTSANTPVREIMAERVLYVDPDQDVGDCMALMTEHRFRHLPVMEDGRVVGVISIGDTVKAIIDEQSFTIEQLEKYITS